MTPELNIMFLYLGSVVEPNVKDNTGTLEAVLSWKNPTKDIKYIPAKNEFIKNIADLMKA